MPVYGVLVAYRVERTAYVEAASSSEARAKVRQGNWAATDDEEIGDITARATVRLPDEIGQRILDQG